MNTRIKPLIILSSLIILQSCASPPMGPTVQVLPSPTKPFSVFQQDQVDCKAYAQSQVAGQAEAANQKAVGTAVVGTALGAALGAAVGNHQGAGVGAGVGALAGTGVAANGTQAAQQSIQDQYNNAYLQCMYSKGNQVPGVAPAAATDSGALAPIPDATASIPGQTMSVAEAQSRLNSLGYPVGAADGVMGPRTRAQLKSFQKAHGLPETGELDTATITALST
jgi:hypothetical protein